MPLHRLTGELARWQELPIKFLILATATFVVFIDEEGDLDWETTDEYDEEGHEDDEAHHQILNEAARLETTPCTGLPTDMCLHFKRLVGEGIARSLEHDYSAARLMLKRAAEYIVARSQETSRRWFLAASFQAVAPFVLVGVWVWTCRGFFRPLLGEVAFWLCLAAVAGSIGALLSVISRTGNQRYDSASGRLAHTLEATSRIVAGAVSGIAVGLAVHSQIVFGTLTAGGKMSAVLILAALASGASERLAPSILARMERIDTQREERATN